MSFSRRQVLHAGLLTATAAAAGRFVLAEATSEGTSGAKAADFARLDEFIERYMREMSSPGMSLVLADRSGVRRVASYGFGDVEHRAADHHWPHHH